MTCWFNKCQLKLTLNKPKRYHPISFAHKVAIYILCAYAVWLKRKPSYKRSKNANYKSEIIFGFVTSLLAVHFFFSCSHFPCCLFLCIVKSKQISFAQLLIFFTRRNILTWTFSKSHSSWLFSVFFSFFLSFLFCYFPSRHCLIQDSKRKTKKRK